MTVHLSNYRAYPLPFGSSIPPPSWFFYVGARLKNDVKWGPTPQIQSNQIISSKSLVRSSSLIYWASSLVYWAKSVPLGPKLKGLLWLFLF